MLVQQGKLTEFYFIGYMTVWAGYRLVDAAISKPPGAIPPEAKQP